ncbi:hypothetical protein [Mycobacterium sp.]|uniref:hypothetical protein n=1 Tax=Mycobacterium sp. TaxID=1785 RepID=UPI002D098DA3|nr:hypothetical protein [Mycobacterium sp.]HTQ22732.1 hypothetical protein [Mycobacterium sp.]
MIASGELVEAPFDISQIERSWGSELPTTESAARAGERSFAAIGVLLLWQTAGLAVNVLAICMARRGGGDGPWFAMSAVAYALTYASALWALTRRRLARALRNAAVICLGLIPALQCHLNDPVLFTGYDEQLHMRTLSDILTSHRLFQPNPSLAISPHYPGLEALTVFVHQLGLPATAAALLVVVVVARLVLVLVLCDAVEHLTGSARTGGLAVAVYAVASQFAWFNSMFSYQTLALPLALAGVAFIARARWARDPRQLFIGATVCLLAVVVTHHITSWLAAAFLAVWTVAERDRQARRRVFCGALIAVTATVSWAMVQRELLQNYFRPIFDDVVSQVSGGERRQPFSDPAGFRTPLWEQIFLVYYAAAITLVVALIVLTYALSVLQRRRRGALSSDSRRWGLGALLVPIAALIPVTMAVRFVPSWAEVGDRATGFLYLPFSLLAADCGVRWFQSLPRHHSRIRRPRLTKALEWLGLLLATSVFVGGLLLGSGPDWMRLPGGYLTVADVRSMDAETLAAVRWAGDELVPGTRIGADRVSAILLASQARLWPVMKEDQEQLYTPQLYYTDEWTSDESEVARRLELQYLYVDQRWADDKPHAGEYYFYHGDTAHAAAVAVDPEPRKLTNAELTKFDNVPGIHAVYRHGPIVIYDLSGLGVPFSRSGWCGDTGPIDILKQLLIGLAAGLALGLVGRSGAMPRIMKKLKSFQIAAGPSLTFAAGVGALCFASVLIILAHIWLAPLGLLSMALVALLLNPHWAVHPLRKLRNMAPRIDRKWFAVSTAAALLATAAIAQAVYDAAAVDVSRAQNILHDPSAVHSRVPGSMSQVKRPG